MVVAQNDNALEEQRLAALVSEGDQEAFRVLFERHSGRVYRFCMLMLGDKAASEDIYQEAFVAFWQACKAGKTMYNVQGYLITVARSRCLNYLRVANRNSSLDDVTEPSYIPDETISDRDEHIRRALLRLPDQYREAIVLSEFEGYSYEEMARTLDVTHHVVKNRIYRAKNMLRDFLRPLLSDQHDWLT